MLSTCFYLISKDSADQLRKVEIRLQSCPLRAHNLPASPVTTPSSDAGVLSFHSEGGLKLRQQSIYLDHTTRYQNEHGDKNLRGLGIYLHDA